MKLFENPINYLGVVIVLTITLIAFSFSACGNCVREPAGYLKVEEPPDVNKEPHNHSNSPTCWMATAANMLAAAGYAEDHPDIAEIQIKTKQDLIYIQMLQIMPVNYGFTHRALENWLEKYQECYPNILYRWPYVVGELDDPPLGVSPAWQNPEGPKILGILMRECNFVGIGLYRVENTPDDYWAHAVSCWGDEIDDDEAIEDNPNTARVTDSDIVGSSGYEEYMYDDYYNPNPGHDNVGEGWYLNYPQVSHPYIKHFYVLSELEFDNGDNLVAGVVGEYMLTQSNEADAEALSYQIASISTILKKKFELLSPQYRSLPYTPVLKENAPEPTRYDVNWDLSTDPIPAGRSLIASTLVVLPLSSPLEFNKIRFSHGSSGETTEFPGIKWHMETPRIENAENIPNATGGYVIGHFEIYEEGSGGSISEKVGEYRLVQQYRYNHKPEEHTFVISGTSGSLKYKIKNLKFGHSYGLLTGRELWSFNRWKSSYADDFVLSPSPKDILIVWPVLPYPRGMDSTK
jgi:hypothetical protein